MYDMFEKLMEVHGVTPYKICKQTGIAQATLSDWKNGKSKPKAEKIKKIAAFFEVDERVFYDASIITCPYCGLTYAPTENDEIKRHHDYHIMWKLAVEKFGFCWAQNKCEIEIATADAVVKNDDLPLAMRFDSQLNIFKAFYSQSLSANNYHLGHPDFDSYVSMLLDNETINSIPIEIQDLLIEKYGKASGIMSGTVYGIAASQQGVPLAKAPFAAYGRDEDDFTAEEIGKINSFIDFVRNERKKRS